MKISEIVKEIEKPLQKLEGLFTSGKAQAAIQAAVAFVPQAVLIVQEIDTLVPNKTGPEVIAAAKKLLATDTAVQPILDEAATNPGGALLALATAILKKNLPAQQANVATNLLNTAVQLAVTAIHA